MKTLVIQPGHYGRTTGATGTPGEKEWALKVARALSKQMRQLSGWTTMTVMADTDDSSYRGNAFVSIHADGAAAPSAFGSSFGYQSAGGRALGLDWRHVYLSLRPEQRLREPNYTKNLAEYYGVRKAIRQGNTRAAIFEFGFMTNPKEREWLESHVEECAATIYRAVTGEWPMSDDPYLINPSSVTPFPLRTPELRLEGAISSLPRVEVDPHDRHALRRSADLIAHQQGTVVDAIKPRFVPRAVVEWILKNLLDLLYRS